MENNSLEELEQKLAEHQAEAALLKAKITEARQTKHSENIASIRQLMAELAVSVNDLQPGEAKKEVSKTRSPGKPVPPKYIDPETKITWSGRGATPNWLKTYAANGRNRDEFLIDKQAL
jgi:DNA-binding protein H-NS